MSTHERKLLTDIPPERLWALWTDTATWGDWNPDVESMTLEGPFRAGTQARMRTRAGREHRMRLVQVEPGRSFELETSPMPLTRFTFRCQVLPSGARTEISQGVRMSGPMGALMSRMAGERVADGFTPILEGLARAAGKARS